MTYFGAFLHSLGVLLLPHQRFTVTWLLVMARL